MNEIEMLKASLAALERERDELRERYKDFADSSRDSDATIRQNYS